MRVQLEIDATYQEINTRDPETMARWLVEWFAVIQRVWTPATFIRFNVQPTYNFQNGHESDWITNPALNGPISSAIHTPAEFVAELADRLADLGADR